MKSDNHQRAAQHLKDVEKRLVDLITRLGSLKGRSTKTATVTAYIVIRRTATQKLLRERTGYSLGTISTTLQTLEKIGFVHKTRDPKSREYRYELDPALAQAGSPSMTNLFEYFTQLKAFLQEIQPTLRQPHLSDKRGFEPINRFITGMDRLLPAIEHAMRKVTMPLLDAKEGNGNGGR